jgi:plasmid stabilization system protein ParE
LSQKKKTTLASDPALLLCPGAPRDLDTIHAYIAANPARAQVFIEHIRDGCRLLRSFPLMARARPEFAHVDPAMRSIPVKPVTVFYRHVDEHRLGEILRVIDGRRDLGTIFPEDI